MYRTILVALDASPCSQRAALTALELAARWDARLVALHVTPDIARRDARLGREPRPVAASSLPGTVASLMREAASRKLACETKEVTGRAFEAIVAQARELDGALVVVGSTGEEADGRRLVGSTAERVVRSSRNDVLVVRPEGGLLAGQGAILCSIDGSPQSYGGLKASIELSRTLSLPLEAVAVYDPYLHYTLFNGIVGVLSEKASKVFKFKDQEKLHEEIIDTGLAKIYQAHLEVARHVAAEDGVTLKITLLDGKAHQKVLKHATRSGPSLIVIGRIGVHSDQAMDVGATTENILRTAPCDVLVCSRTFVPPIDVRASESVQWTAEALAKMERVPSFVRGVARTAVIRWAIERGHSIVTPSVINSCMGDILPPSAAQAMGYVAEETAKAALPEGSGKTWICAECGHAARDYRPVTCPVCMSDGKTFEAIDRTSVASLGELKKGDIEVEETFDGKTLQWTAGAKDVLRRVPNGYERRRAKARIEKTAKVRGLALVDEPFALDMVQQEMADTSYLSDKGERMKVEVKKEEIPDDVTPRPRDASPLPWTDAAWKRICRVPEGFMRDMTREKVEEFAAGKALTTVDLALCEEGIAEGRRMMAEMLGSYKKGGDAQAAVRAAARPPEPSAS